MKEEMPLGMKLLIGYEIFMVVVMLALLPMALISYFMGVEMFSIPMILTSALFSIIFAVLMIVGIVKKSKYLVPFAIIKYLGSYLMSIYYFFIEYNFIKTGDEILRMTMPSFFIRSVVQFVVGLIIMGVIIDYLNKNKNYFKENRLMKGDLFLNISSIVFVICTFVMIVVNVV